MQDFNFYKVNETLNHKYYQIPQELFINPLYKNALNSDSKLLYGFLLDRLSLSIKNNWHDKDGNVYICSDGRVIADAFIENGECLVDIPESEKRYVSNTQPPVPLCIKDGKIQNSDDIEK